MQIAMHIINNLGIFQIYRKVLVGQKEEAHTALYKGLGKGRSLGILDLIQGVLKQTWDPTPPILLSELFVKCYPIVLNVSICSVALYLSTS